MPSPALPSYALDGRRIEWSADKTAAAFHSTEAEYHGDANAVSASMLKIADRSLAHLKEALSTPVTPTKAMILGSAMHCAALEPHLFQSRYAVWSGKRAGKPYQAFLANLPPGVITLSQTERETIDAQVATLLRTPVVRNLSQTFALQDLIEVGHRERNYYWADSKTGMTCRARMDLTVAKLDRKSVV